MNRKIRQLAGLVMALQSTLFISATAVANDDPGCGSQGGNQMQGQGQDWVQHTRLTLDSLKAELALTPSQTGAWDRWSGGVMTDAKKQMEQKKERHEERAKQEQLTEQETTPQQMARGIAHLREENSWMQKHITQLQAAQVRTATFYKSLTPSQKSSFDLFWRAMHHRMNDGHGCMTPDHGMQPESAEKR